MAEFYSDVHFKQVNLAAHFHMMMFLDMFKCEIKHI